MLGCNELFFLLLKCGMNTPISSMPRPPVNQCPACGAHLHAGGLGGLCPACLLRQGTAANTTPATAFEPPSLEELARLFPQLELLALIGTGGMGAVYKARQRELDRIVALKILPPGIGEAPAFAERFSREARALAKLNHPGIVTIHDFGRADGLYYFLMEYVDGLNLRQLLRAGRIVPREALAIVPQICDALQYAHDHGIVHRDIKPENILLDRQGRVKVADFGLAKLMGDAEPGADTANPPADAMTAAGLVMGTPAYMAPEQHAAPADVDHRADIYSLGVVFYQMLTGELPGRPLEPPSRRVMIDVRLDQVVLRALERQPEHRYQQVSEVKTMVEALGESPKHTAPPPSPRVVPVRLTRLGLAVPGSVVALHVVVWLWVAGTLTFLTPWLLSVWQTMGAALPAHLYRAMVAGRFLQRGGIFLLPILCAADVGICWFLQRHVKRWALVAWGGAGLLPLLLLPSLYTVPHYDLVKLANSPQALRGACTDVVIEAGVTRPEQPWAWQELQRRAAAGRLTPSDADLLVQRLTEWLRREYPDGYPDSLNWLCNLLENLHRRDLVRSKTALDFLAAWHGNPEVEPLPRLREGPSALPLSGNLGNPWSGDLFGFKLLNELRGITVDGQPVEWMNKHFFCLDNRFSVELTLPPLAPGRHLVRGEVLSAFVSAEDAAGLPGNAPSKEWPPFKSQRLRVFEAALDVFASDAVLVTLTTEPGWDPQAFGVLDPKPIIVRSSGAGASVVIQLVSDHVKAGGATKLAMSFDATVRLGNAVYPAGSIWGELNGGRRTWGDALGASVSPLNPAIRTADLVLTPNPTLIESRPGVDRIWGGEVVFRDIPLDRQDLAQPEARMFGPVFERELRREPTVGEACFLDLDSGQFHVPPPDVWAGYAPDWHKRYQDSRLEAWIRTNGIDVALLETGSITAFDCHWVVDPASNTVRWHDTTAAALLNAVERHQQRSRSLHPWLSNAVAGGGFAFWFITREGGTGLGEVLRVTSDPPAIRIRYKLVEPFAGGFWDALASATHRPVVMVVGLGRKATVGGREIALDRIAYELRASGLPPETPIAIQAHPQTPYADVTQILEALRAAGFPHVNFVATPNDE